ncbi:MAG: response regulator [Desulfomonilaceae bacterium]
MEQYRVLVADGDKNLAQTIVSRLKSGGVEAVAVDDADAALAFMGEEVFDVFILDMTMSAKDSLKILREAKEKAPFTATIAMTSYGEWESAIEVLQNGAYDFMTKPLNVHDLLKYVNRAYLSRDAAQF